MGTRWLLKQLRGPVCTQLASYVVSGLRMLAYTGAVSSPFCTAVPVDYRITVGSSMAVIYAADQRHGSVWCSARGWLVVLLPYPCDIGANHLVEASAEVLPIPSAELLH